MANEDFLNNDLFKFLVITISEEFCPSRLKLKSVLTTLETFTAIEIISEE